MFCNQQGRDGAVGCGASDDAKRSNRWWGGKSVGPLDVSEADLAKEMNDLTVEERQKVFEDIHGVASIEEETPEFVSKILNEMDDQIREIPKTKRKALDRAIFFRPSIQSDTDFKLLFLRSEAYNAQRAATRMGNFFELKLELFGEGLLAKRITLEDLDEDAIRCLREGAVYQLPRCDQTGRPTLFFDMGKFDICDPINMIRCFWYVTLTTTMESKTAQLKGLSEVCYLPIDLKEDARQNIKYLCIKGGYMMLNCEPVRPTSIHICTNDTMNHWMPALFSMLRAIVGRSGRLRMKNHFGSGLELKYALMAFGIHCSNSFGDENTCEEQEDVGMEYLNRRREIEQAAKEVEMQLEATSGVVLNPQSNDVLLGRGRPFRDFVGNRRWGSLIESRLDRYTNADKFGKTVISLEVLKAVQEVGGRFLQQTSGGWKLVDDENARDTTRRAFKPRMSKTPVVPARVASSVFGDAGTGSAKRLKYDMV